MANEAMLDALTAVQELERVPATEWATPELETRTLNLPLDQLTVILPTGQVLINGQPFVLAVEAEQLARTVRSANRTNRIGHKHNFPVNGLTVEFGETLPEMLLDRGRKGTGLLYNGLFDNVELQIPQEVVKSSEQVDELKDLYEKSMNEDLERGVLQSIVTREEAAKRRRRFSRAYLVGLVTGFFAGVTALPDQTGGVVSLIERGAAGSAVGAMIVGAIALGRLDSKPTTYGFLSKNVVKKADRMIANPGTLSYPDSLAKSFSNRLIKLVPVVSPDASPPIQHCL